MADTYMDDELKQLMRQQMRALPPVVRSMLASPEFAKKIKQIGQKYALHIDQIGILGDEITLLVLGLADPQEFTKGLSSRSGMPSEIAIKIENDVAALIFEPLSDALRKATSAPTPARAEHPIAAQAGKLPPAVARPVPVRPSAPGIQMQPGAATAVRTAAPPLPAQNQKVAAPSVTSAVRPPVAVPTPPRLAAMPSAPARPITPPPTSSSRTVTSSPSVLSSRPIPTSRHAPSQPVVSPSAVRPTPVPQRIALQPIAPRPLPSRPVVAQPVAPRPAPQPMSVPPATTPAPISRPPFAKPAPPSPPAVAAFVTPASGLKHVRVMPSLNDDGKTLVPPKPTPSPILSAPAPAFALIPMTPQEAPMPRDSGPAPAMPAGPSAPSAPASFIPLDQKSAPASTPGEVRVSQPRAYSTRTIAAPPAFDPFAAAVIKPYKLQRTQGGTEPHPAGDDNEILSDPFAPSDAAADTAAQKVSPGAATPAAPSISNIDPFAAQAASQGAGAPQAQPASDTVPEPTPSKTGYSIDPYREPIG